jgi:hypothetical protein
MEPLDEIREWQKAILRDAEWRIWCQFQERLDLDGYRGATTWDDYIAWHRRLYEHIYRIADANATEAYDGSRRAACPLCGALPEQNTHGFKVFEGLERRHLNGGGSSRQCLVIRALDQLTHEFSWRLDRRPVPTEVRHA